MAGPVVSSRTSCCRVSNSVIMSGVRRLAAWSTEYCRWARHSTFRASLEQRKGGLRSSQTWLAGVLSAMHLAPLLQVW